jgi:hypothetical protein
MIGVGKIALLSDDEMAVGSVRRPECGLWISDEM